MVPILFKPNFYSLRNELKREYAQRFWNRTTFALLFIAFILFGMYSFSYSFFLKLKSHEVYSIELLQNFLSISTLALMSVTCFSAIISALSSFFASKELQTLLSAPIALHHLFVARFCNIYMLATWMFLLIATSFGFGLMHAFSCSISVALFWLVNFLTISLLPTSIGVICVILCANIIPAERLREVVILSVILGLFFLLSVDHNTTMEPQLPESLARAVSISNQFPVTKIEWLPNNYLAKIITSSLQNSISLDHSFWFLQIQSWTALIISYLVFNSLFIRGWAKSTDSNVQRISYKSDTLSTLGNILFREPSTTRAFIGKEIRTFLRDTTQSVQLLLLLTLTFIYLYNFRIMHSNTIINDSFKNIWNVVLSCANILFSGCVTAAICTRFVFPSISLEGATYQVLMTTPISMREFIKAKFLTWYIPVAIISLILFISGGWAISSEVEIIASFAFISLLVSASSVALALAAGAIYARFDWDNPIQVISSFGSLVYMFFATISLSANLVPASILFVLYYSQFIQKHMFFVDRSFAIIGVLFFILIFNIAILKKALITAENSLLRREQ